MVIGKVFGHNLRALCARRGTIVSISRDLDISRVQFNRYLNSESFPKPAVLDKICKYFRVDARILTDVLSEKVIDSIDVDASPPRAINQNFGLQNAVSYLIPSSTMSKSQDMLPEGLYLLWRQSMALPGKVVASTIQIESVPGFRVFRGFVLPGIYSSVEYTPPKIREFRGVIFDQPDGYAFCLFQQPPIPIMAFFYLAYPFDNADTVLKGYMVLARNEYLGKQRMSRCVMEKLPRTAKGILKAAHTSGWVEWDDVPEHIKSEISLPIDKRH